MALDLELKVLAGIIPNRSDRLLFATARLSEEHFQNSIRKNLFILVERYYNMTAEILPKAMLADLLRREGADVSRSLLYEELYEDASVEEVSDGEFRYSVDSLRDLRAQLLTGEVITTAFEILERGVEVNHEELRGHDQARSYLYEELSRIDRLGHGDIVPEGDIRLEAKEMKQEYAERKASVNERGVFMGIEGIDSVTSGFQKGELVLIAAYTGEGKSHLVTQTAWNASVMQGKNVFFATSETVRAQVRRRLLSRHSMLPKFGLGSGLNSKDIKEATLAELEPKHDEVIDDLHANSAYGHLYIAQVPRGADLGYVEARMSRQQAEWDIDLVVIDYLALLKPERKREANWAEMSELLKDAKSLATSFNHGEGVPIISPWQMSQTAYKDAMMRGEYTLANLAETSEAEKSSDIIISLLRMVEQRNAVKMQLLKNRDGDQMRPVMLEADYRFSYLGAESSSYQSVDSILTDGVFGGGI